MVYYILYLQPSSISSILLQVKLYAYHACVAGDQGDLIELYKHPHKYYTVDADYINLNNQN